MILVEEMNPADTKQGPRKIFFFFFFVWTRNIYIYQAAPPAPFFFNQWMHKETIDSWYEGIGFDSQLLQSNTKTQ